MELPAITSSLMAPLTPTSSVPRARPEAVAPERAGSTRDAADQGGDRAARARAESARASRQPEETRALEDAEAIRAAREERERLLHATDGGGYRFEMEGRTHVMKVVDSKDVLIYQVPPKGVLELIKARESEPPPQVRTSV